MRPPHPEYVVQCTDTLQKSTHQKKTGTKNLPTGIPKSETKTNILHNHRWRLVVLIKNDHTTDQVIELDRVYYQGIIHTEINQRKININSAFAFAFFTDNDTSFMLMHFDYYKVTIEFFLMKMHFVEFYRIL